MEKTSGIYKIYIDKEQDEWNILPCYIGVSINIEGRWKSHKTQINGILKNKDNLLIQSLEETAIIDARRSFNLKIAMYLINHNLKIDDLKFEIIKEKKFNFVEEIEPEEQKLIDKFNTEWWGWNGIFAKQHKYKNSLLDPSIEPEDKLKYENLLKIDEVRIFKVIKKNKDSNHSPYIDWLLGEKLSNNVKDRIYNKAKQSNWVNYCNFTYKNYQIWWAKNQFDYMKIKDLYNWIQENTNYELVPKLKISELKNKIREFLKTQNGQKYILKYRLKNKNNYKDISIILAEGINLLEKHQYKKAERNFDEVLIQKSKNWRALFGKICCLEYFKKYDEALLLFEKLMIIVPKSKMLFCWFKKGNIYSKLHGSTIKNTEEINCYDEVLKIDPYYVEARIYKSLALARGLRFNEAKDEIKKGLQLDPNNEELLSLYDGYKNFLKQ